MSRSEARPPSAHRGSDALGIEAVMMTPELLRAVIHVLVWDAEDLEIDARTAFREQLADG